MPFTQDQYELVRDLVINMLADPDFGIGTHDDERQRRVLDEFTRAGLLSFDRLLTENVDAAVESKMAHDAATALTQECVRVAGEHPDWPEFLITQTATESVSSRPPFARLDDQFAVHRSERTLIEASCSAFIAMAVLETTTDENPVPGLEAVAQSLRLMWLQWFVWNKPLEYAAFQGQDEIP